MLSALNLAVLIAGATAQVLLPSQDPFYTQPSNISAYQPGDVITARSILPILNGLQVNGSALVVQAAYQYLYRTTDSLGNPVAAVTTLLVPFNAINTKLLAYQTAYDSANNDCSPSYAFRHGANSTASSDIVFITASLNNGWYVLSPDYEGLLGQYSAGVISGYATLDSVRAALSQASSSGLSPTARYAMWGYSGGSIASERAAEFQPSYAPELHFQGTALGGVIGNGSNVVDTINNGSFAGLAFSALYGLSKAYPNLTTWLNDNLIPSKKDQFYSIAGGCLSQASSAGANQDLYSFFTRGKAASYDPVVVSVLQIATVMGQHIPTIPLFIYKAVGDEISPVADTDEVVATYCSAGATVEYHRDVIGEHISEAIFGSASALSWVADRLNGIPVANKGCVKLDVALSTLTLGTVAELPVELVSVLEDLAGGRPGLLISG